MYQYPPQPQQDQQYQQYQDQQQQQIYQPMMNQQYNPQQEYSNYPPHYELPQQDSEATPALLDHINYVNTTYVQFQSGSRKTVSTDTYLNNPKYYNFNVQANLPFRIDTIKIENLYDATRVDVYKECFLDPISEDNQFQGWSESRLSHHPFMLSIQEICGNLKPKVNVHIFLSFMVLALILTLNLICLAKIINKDGNGFGKIIGVLVFLSAIQLILTVMMGLQMIRILRGFGALIKLIIIFFIIWLDVIFYLPIIYTYVPTIGFLPFIMAMCQIVGFLVFVLMNKSQILTNSQLYLLINGHIKALC